MITFKELKRKLKKDKKFLFMFILGSVLLLSLVISNLPSKKEARQSWETCNEFNDAFEPVPFTWDGVQYWKTLFSATKIAACKSAGCFNGRIIVDNVLNVGGILDRNVCVPVVPNGWAVENSYITSGCIEGAAFNYPKDTEWSICKDVPEEDQINDNEAAIAQFADMLGLSDLSPRAKYNIVLYGGGFMLFMIVSAIM